MAQQDPWLRVCVDYAAVCRSVSGCARGCGWLSVALYGCLWAAMGDGSAGGDRV